MEPCPSTGAVKELPHEVAELVRFVEQLSAGRGFHEALHKFAFGRIGVREELLVRRQELAHDLCVRSEVANHCFEAERRRHGDHRAGILWSYRVLCRVNREQVGQARVTSEEPTML